ncbi:MAG: SLBB domain-containing protein [Acidobacteriota bacterium]
MRGAPRIRAETAERGAGPVLDALLGAGSGVLVPVRGDSMRPALAGGDHVLVAPFLGLPRPGQIVLARRADGLVVHRLRRIEWRDGRRLYRLQGDALPYPDAGVLREDLMGRVVAVVRDGRRIDLDDRPAALRRDLRRLALRRVAPRLVRAVAVVLAVLLCTLGRGSASQVSTMAPSPEYRFGAGDILSLRVWDGETIDEIQMTVQSDGEAFLPIKGIGSLPIGGRTVLEVKRELQERLQAIYRETHVELLLIKYAGHRVHLMGEVRSTARMDSGPGEWALKGPTRLVRFLSDHGGPTPQADLMRIHVIRRSGQRHVVNLFRAVFQGVEADDPPLESGDLVFVPSLAMGNRKVFVLGEVRDPGVVDIIDRMGLVEAISRAGGFTSKGYMKGVIVLKRRGGGEVEMRVANFKKMYKEGSLEADIPLQPGDIVFVPRRALATLQEVFSVINPALNIIESIFIIDRLSNTN